MVQPGTGDVKAISQSRPMGRDAKAGQTYLNYVVPQKYGDSNGFQPGSTFKAFVLAAAIQQGIPLTENIYVADGGQHPDEPVPRLRRTALRQHRHLGTSTARPSSGNMNAYPAPRSR